MSRLVSHRDCSNHQLVRHLAKTQEVPVVTVPEPREETKGRLRNNCDLRCDLARTQEIPAVVLDDVRGAGCAVRLVTRTERGWPGHFCASKDCVFRRNTLLDNGARKIVVSTVGQYRRNGNVEIIGCNRYYETMAFAASNQGGYWDADVGNEVDFSSPWALPYYDTPTVDNDANDMHEAVVAELISVLSEDHGVPVPPEGPMNRLALLLALAIGCADMRDQVHAFMRRRESSKSYAERIEDLRQQVDDLRSEVRRLNQGK